MKRPNSPGTNISCAFDAIDAYFQSSSSPDEERWLFVVSDLIQERAFTASCTSSSSETLLSNTRVVLLYPHDSQHEWRKIIDSWRHFLGDRQLDVYPISAALNRPFVLPPNPVAGLEGYGVKGFWENVRSLVSHSESTP